MPKLSEKLKAEGFKDQPKPTKPVWEGPCGDGPRGGITFSLLSRWLTCKERARLLLVKGLKPVDTFNAPIEFGNMWHACEEGLAGGKDWWDNLRKYTQLVSRTFPMQQEQVSHWYEICNALFPIYQEHWANHKDVCNRTPLMQEQTFRVPYHLPSGRVVQLRGKWDSVDLVGIEGEKSIWLQENKTKTSIDQLKITRQVGYDLQVMIYLIALKDTLANNCPRDYNQVRVAGVRYNVIRRSAHKSADSMLKKVKEDQANNRADEWFSRWNIEVLEWDIKAFRKNCLDPMLENLCWWWEEVTGLSHGKHKFPPTHWRHPLGCRNILDEGGSTDLDAYLESGSTAGLRVVDNLFPEL